MSESGQTTMGLQRMKSAGSAVIKKNQENSWFGLLSDESLNSRIVKKDGKQPCRLTQKMKLMTSEKSKSTVYKMIIAVAFIDLIGPLMLGPAEVVLCLKGKHPMSFTSIPVPYSLARTFLQSAATIGQTICAGAIVPFSDKLGRKPFLLLFTWGGGAVFVFTSILGDARITGDSAYYLYLLGKFLMGVFGGTRALVTVYVQDIYEVQEAIKKNQLVLILSLIAAAAGSVLGGVIVNATGNLLGPAMLCVVLQAAAGLITLFGIPEPVRKDKEERQEEVVQDANQMDLLGKDKPIPTRKIKGIFVAAAFDQLGTQGLLASLTLILVLWYPDPFSDAGAYGNAGAVLILFIVLGMFGAIPTMSKRGPGYNAVVGNCGTCLAQVILLFMTESWIGFLAVLYLGYAVSFFSTISYGPMLNMIVPAHARAKYNGYYMAINNACTFVAPLTLASLIAIGPQGPTIALCVTIAFSFIAIFLACPLLRAYGAPKKSRQVSADEIAQLREDGCWMPMNELFEENGKRMAAGEDIVKMQYGDYNKDKTRLPLIRKQGLHDFKTQKEMFTAILETIEQKPETEATFEANIKGIWTATFDHLEKGEMDMDFEEMGQWVGRYLVESGYLVTANPSMFKIMFMHAFPPRPPYVDRGDGRQAISSIKEGLQFHLATIQRQIDTLEESEFSPQAGLLNGFKAIRGLLIK